MRKEQNTLIKGQRFGSLVVTGNKKMRQYKNQRLNLYEVACDCGNKTFVTKGNLIKGQKKCLKCCFYSKYKELGEKFNLSRGAVYHRLTRNIPLNFPRHKHFRKRVYHQDPNSMAGLGRQVGKSREMIRLLINRGMTKEQIIERYKK